MRKESRRTRGKECGTIPYPRAPCAEKNQEKPLGLSRFSGCFPFTKRFRKFRSGCKWNMIFRFVLLENFRKKWNFWLFTIYMEKPVGRWFVQMESKIPILEISVWGGVYHLNNRPNLPKEPRATLTSSKWRLKSLYSTRL